MAKRDDEHDDEIPAEDDESPEEGEWDEDGADESDDEDNDESEEENAEGDEDEEGWELIAQTAAAAAEEEGAGESPARRAGLLRFEEALTLEGQIEAVIFASPKPVRVDEILEIVQTDDMAYDEPAIQAVLDQLTKLYAERNGGFRLEVLKGGYQFQTVPAAAPLMERLFSSRPRPLSRAALETLAIIAYRQPVTRADVEFIRGVDAGSIIKNLMERDLITCVGRKEDAGRPMLFGTTTTFLEIFRLNNLKDLPPLSAFQPAQEMVNEAASKLGAEDESVDVEGFVADRENRELSEDEREFLTTEEEGAAEGEFAAESATDENDSEESEDSEEFEDVEGLEASAEDDDSESLSDEEAEDESEEETQEVEPELEAAGDLEVAEEEALDVEVAEDEPSESVVEPDPDNPFWELDVAAQKTTKTKGRVLKGASARQRGVKNDKGGANAASEVDSSPGAGVEAGSRDVDSGGKDKGQR